MQASSQAAPLAYAPNQSQYNENVDPNDNKYNNMRQKRSDNTVPVFEKTNTNGQRLESVVQNNLSLIRGDDEQSSASTSSSSSSQEQGFNIS